MSKTIKLEDQVYGQLDDLRGKGETFSDVVKQLVDTRENVFQLINILEGKVRYREWQARELAKLQKSIPARDIL